MYLVKALRLFVGTNAERTAAGIGAFLPGDEYHETDTDSTFQHNGTAWIQKNTTPAGTDGQLQYNNGGVFGGAGIYWNDAQNQLLVNNSTPAFAGTVAEFHDAATAASIAIVNDTASADANIAATSYYLKNTSELQTAFGYFSVGSVTRTNGAEDGYFDISVMRGGTLTSMLDIRPSVITLNPGEGDTDVRIAGNGVTNGVFWDAGNSRLGVNVEPGAVFHVHNNAASSLMQRDATGNALINSFYNANTTDGNGAFVVFEGDTTGAGAATRQQFSLILAKMNTHDHATRDADLQFFTVQGGSLSNRMTLGSGLVMGSPTGGDKGVGWINVAGGISLNNSNYANPDYALNHYFHGDLGPFADNPGADKYGGLVPLEGLENYLRKNLHLPNRWDSQNVFEWVDMAQMWCEELAIYITQLHKRVKELENGS